MIFSNRIDFKITATPEGLKIALANINVAKVEDNMYIDDQYNIWKLMFTKTHDDGMKTYSFFKCSDHYKWRTKLNKGGV
jgi:hypothetical protein